MHFCFLSAPRGMVFGACALSVLTGLLASRPHKEECTDGAARSRVAGRRLGRDERPRRRERDARGVVARRAETEVCGSSLQRGGEGECERTRAGLGKKDSEVWSDLELEGETEADADVKQRVTGRGGAIGNEHGSR